nr:hypothetical protein BaRGS_021190 [Batillaria attramentaria]
MRCDSELRNKTKLWMTAPPPARVDFDGRGDFTVTSLNVSDLACPETHFQCPGDGYCLPVYVRCNGVYDCPGKEDEAACDSYTCPGFYRCRASRICLHPDHMDDGVSQCPQRDDELARDLRCPNNHCTCFGAAFLCTRPFPTKEYSDLRYLDARGSGMTSDDLTDNTMLIYLSLADCDLTHAGTLTFPNLHSLDLNDNDITTLTAYDLVHVPHLQFLSLAGNPITDSFFPNLRTDQIFLSMNALDLSFVSIEVLNGSLLSIFPSLQTINLSYCGIDRVVGQGFQALKDLHTLDMSGCPVTEFPRDMLLGLEQLEEVYADNYKLCCPDMLPAGFRPSQCRAPTDEISSCDALLRSDVYRVLLAVFSALALLGNLISLSYRTFFNKVKNTSGFGAFVTHLCVSDFLMGVYLAIIGIADRVYLGTYLWSDLTWKRSVACKLAGFLSLLSSEVSAFIICLITLDRFLVLRFPFSAFHFKSKSAHLACLVAWVMGLFLACVPLLPVTSHWEFYSQTGICIPLPITRKDFPGHDYSFAIMIVLNFILFLLIAAGQVVIYWSIRVNSMSTSDSTKKSKDLTIARRLFTVVMSDFLCWFPIGLLGLLASNGVAVPGEVNVVMAIIVLPLNSALNPFLYTVNTILERRRKAWELRVQQRLMQAHKLSTTITNTERTKTENTHTG